MRAHILALLVPLYTRRCRGCADTSPHTDHMTRFGNLRYLGHL